MTSRRLAHRTASAPWREIQQDMMQYGSVIGAFSVCKDFHTMSTAPVDEPTTMSFTGSTIADIAAVVSTYSASADCTDSATPTCRPGCLRRDCRVAVENFTPNDAYDSLCGDFETRSTAVAVDDHASLERQRGRGGVEDVARNVPIPTHTTCTHTSCDVGVHSSTVVVTSTHCGSRCLEQQTSVHRDFDRREDRLVSRLLVNKTTEQQKRRIGSDSHFCPRPWWRANLGRSPPVCHGLWVWALRPRLDANSYLKTSLHVTGQLKQTLSACFSAPPGDKRIPKRSAPSFSDDEQVDAVTTSRKCFSGARCGAPLPAAYA